MDIRIFEVELHQILVAEVELFQILCFVVWVFIRFLVSEVDHCLRCGYPPDFWFLIWISCSLLTSFGIHRSFVSEVDLEGVVVRTFSC
jgi:hypothetical protein